MRRALEVFGLPVRRDDATLEIFPIGNCGSSFAKGVGAWVDRAAVKTGVAMQRSAKSIEEGQSVGINLEPALCLSA
jgi:hypothetical protein